MEQKMKETRVVVGAKRRRDGESGAKGNTLAASEHREEGDAATREETEKNKKPRQETPATTNECEEQQETHDEGTEQDATDDVDAEAELMRALEEAIEQDAAEATKRSIPTVVDEDDDYDESD